MANDTKLSTNITVADYRQLEQQQNKDAIADFINERFSERYLLPFDNNIHKHGFSMMAISCLMIESLESFMKGWENSNSKSALAFCYFFDESNNFNELRGHHEQFYKHVRCGLLHQAETTGGWRINRVGCELLDLDTKTINATMFMSRLKLELQHYVERLKQQEWDSDLWVKTRRKLKSICKNA